MTLAARPRRVALVLFNGLTAGSVTVGPWGVAANASDTDHNNSGGAWVTGTIGGAATAVLVNATSAARPTITVTDFVDILPVPRSSGKPGYNVTVRIETLTASAATLPIVSANTAVDGFATADRIWVGRRSTGAFVSTPSGFTDTFNNSFSLIAGVLYQTDEDCVSFVGVGDSITMGAGSGVTLVGRNWQMRALEEIAAERAALVEYANLGWTGQSTAQFVERAVDAVRLFKPSCLIYSYFSPNDGLGTDTTNAMVSRLVRVAAESEQVGSHIITWTGLPKNADATTGFWIAAQDVWRTNQNAALLQNPSFDVIDAASAVEDRSAPRRYQAIENGYAASLSTDWVHPNDAAIELLKRAAKPTLLACVQGAGY